MRIVGFDAAGDIGQRIILRCDVEDEQAAGGFGATEFGQCIDQCTAGKNAAIVTALAVNG